MQMTHLLNRLYSTFVTIAVWCILLENPDSSIKERIQPRFHSHFDLTEATAGAVRPKKKGGEDREQKEKSGGSTALPTPLPSVHP